MEEVGAQCPKCPTPHGRPHPGHHWWWRHKGVTPWLGQIHRSSPSTNLRTWGGRVGNWWPAVRWTCIVQSSHLPTFLGWKAMQRSGKHYLQQTLGEYIWQFKKNRMKSLVMNGTRGESGENWTSKEEYRYVTRLTTFGPSTKSRRSSPLKILSSPFLGKYLMKALSPRISLQFSMYSAGHGTPSKESQSMSINKKTVYLDCLSQLQEMKNMLGIWKDGKKIKGDNTRFESTCAQNEALWSQFSRVFSLIGSMLRNLFLMRSGMGEFHQQSHLPLMEAFTKVVATFWSFSMLMVGCRFSKKWQSIGWKAKHKVRKNVRPTRAWSKLKRNPHWKTANLVKEVIAVVFVGGGDVLLEITQAHGFHHPPAPPPINALPHASTSSRTNTNNPTTPQSSQN